ncbi:MAG TPA: amidohydrolase family protein, partial [Cyclobacteriaceae bacterium]|nr:amidohydrolase family protein [Cyclobacteriaceae bacterium]
MNFLLKNISWKNEQGQITADVRVKNGIVAEIGNDLTLQKKEIYYACESHFLYPGLINSHDHLEMNLYPLVGNPPYQNYTEWAKDIYKPRESPVKEIERVDIEDRLLWGGIKNLISGVTTVIHHNPWHRALSKKKFPVRVVETAWAHSLAYEKNVEKKFPKTKSPFAIHAAEGVDTLAQEEISKLHDLGLLKQNTVLIHAVGLNEGNVKLIRESKAAIVWCPSSNLFMFGKTLPLNEIIGKIKVALGSDATMTGPATFLDEIRVAWRSGYVTAKEICAMVTSIPAEIFQLEIPSIQVGKPADFWITPAKDEAYLDNLIK